MQSVRTELADGVLQVTLDRQHALNAINEEVLDGLEQVTSQVRQDENVRALVITGAGERAFSVGLDLDLLARGFDDLGYFRSVLDRLNDVLLELEELPVPVMAAVNGVARAGGFELLLACDLVVVADHARIGDGHLDAGVIPGGGASQRAPRRLGGQRARELLLLGRWVRGVEAVDIGLALQSVPQEALLDTAMTMLEPTRTRSRAATGRVKALLHDGEALPLRDAIALEIDRFVGYLATNEEPHEGFRQSRRQVRGS